MPFPEYTGLDHVVYDVPGDPNLVGEWLTLDEVSTVGDSEGECISFPGFSLDGADAVPLASMAAQTLFETTMPALPWINPPIGDVWDSTLFTALDPHPDFFTARFTAGVGVHIPCPTGEGPDDFVRPTIALSSNGDPLVTSSVNDDFEASREGWLLPLSQILPDSVPFEAGTEGTQLLWNWGTLPTFTATYPFTFKELFGAQAQVFITPYWLIDRDGDTPLLLCVV